MSTILAGYLATAARRPFGWGRSDCVLFVADWVALATGAPDPAAGWRGAYDSEPEAARRLGWGGVQKIVARSARAIGLARTAAPQPGDIAVVTAAWLPVGARRDAVAAIRVGAGWVMQGRHGLVRVEPSRVRVLAAWRVPWPKP